ncbi:MAG: ribosome maturation factor RimM [Anaerolineales bacterium]|nr:ribosome maturation factor RimM [Anaerolineales bacterium]
MPAHSNRTTKARARSKPTYVAAGRVVRPHGLRGDLLVVQVSDLIRSLQAGTQVFLGSERDPSTVASCRLHGTRWLLRLEGCGDRTQAERWRGTEVAVRVDDLAPLPEGEYFYWQILGLQVVTDQGQDLGKIDEIIETGANDVYVVRSPDQADILLPAISSVVLDVDLAAAQMRIHLIPGLEARS